MREPLISFKKGAQIEFVLGNLLKELDNKSVCFGIYLWLKTVWWKNIPVWCEMKTLI